jgi:hypothetical protein
MIWEYRLLEARSLGTCRVNIFDMGLHDLRSPVFRYRWSILRWHVTTGSKRTGLWVQVEETYMIWNYTVFEARSFSTGRVYSDGI